MFYSCEYLYYVNEMIYVSVLRWSVGRQLLPAVLCFYLWYPFFEDKGWITVPAWEPFSHCVPQNSFDFCSWKSLFLEDSCDKFQYVEHVGIWCRILSTSTWHLVSIGPHFTISWTDLRKPVITVFIYFLFQAVFKIYDKDRDDSINQAEFQSIATNFPFIDDFAMLDTNWYVSF